MGQKELVMSKRSLTLGYSNWLLLAISGLYQQPLNMSAIGG